MQVNIKIQNGIITRIEPLLDSVKISIEDKEYVFDNAFAYPGFVDSHGHIAGLGFQLNGLRLNSAKSDEECVEIATAFNSTRSGWVYGTGWNHELWYNKILPNSKILDFAFPNIPVYLLRVDGHAAWVNTKALQMASIGNSTKNPNGGVIARDATGHPTGILHDNAMDLVSVQIPKFTDTQAKAFIADSIYQLASKGITEVHDMDVYPEFIPFYHELHKDGGLPIRIVSYLRHSAMYKIAEYQKSNSPYLNIAGVKLYADGALGSRSAALLEPYSDDPNNCGIEISSMIEMLDITTKAIELGLQVAIHAIGDKANRNVISVFKELQDRKIADASTKLRLEHAQIIHPDDFNNIAKYNIIPSIQPIHCLSDAPMARKRLTDRCSYSYLWKSFIRSGVDILGGSDFPIESHDPLTGISAFIRRIPFGESESWFPEETLSREEAIKAYTLSPRKVLGNKTRGNLKEGADADITVLDTNLNECTDAEIESAKVVMTICGGRVTYMHSA